MIKEIDDLNLLVTSVRGGDKYDCLPNNQLQFDQTNQNSKSFLITAAINMILC